MIKLKVLKYSAVSSVFGTVLHFACHGYVAVEGYVAKQFQNTVNAAVLDVGTSFGLEPKQEPVSKLSLTQAVENECLKQGVNPALGRAIMKVESGNKAYAISSAGAVGPMQVMLANHKRCKLEHPGKLYDEYLNIKCGVQIIKEELQLYKQVVPALKAYNGGPRCVKTKCVESEAYVPKIMIAMAEDISGLEEYDTYSKR